MPAMEKKESEADSKHGKKKSKKEKKEKKEKKHKKHKKHKKSKHRDEDDPELQKLEEEVANEELGNLMAEGKEARDLLNQGNEEGPQHDDLQDEPILDCKTETAQAGQIIDEMAA